MARTSHPLGRINAGDPRGARGAAQLDAPGDFRILA